MRQGDATHIRCGNKTTQIANNASSKGTDEALTVCTMLRQVCEQLRGHLQRFTLLAFRHQAWLDGKAGVLERSSQRHTIAFVESRMGQDKGFPAWCEGHRMRSNLV